MILCAISFFYWDMFRKYFIVKMFFSILTEKYVCKKNIYSKVNKNEQYLSIINLDAHDPNLTLPLELRPTPELDANKFNYF